MYAGIMGFYQKHKGTIITVVIIIACVIGIIQVLNHFTSENNKEFIKKASNSVNSNTASNSNIANEVVSKKSSLSGDSVNNSKLETESSIIKQFIDYCNSQDFEKAYNLLSSPCKKNLYPEIDDFKKAYYNPTFNGKNKHFSIENWIGNIYKIKISDNTFSDGQINSKKQDYITVVEENSENKLNINGYIESRPLNRIEKINDLTVKVTEENTFMDYCTYSFEFTNDSDNSIIMDSLNQVSSMYIKDSNNVEYSAYTHELSKKQLLVKPHSSLKVHIKYYSKFSSTKTIESIVFSDILFEYIDENNQDNNNYNISKIKINI